MIFALVAVVGLYMLGKSVWCLIEFIHNLSDVRNEE